VILYLSNDDDANTHSQEQDVLHFEPAPIMIVKDMKAIKLLEDPSYYLIVKVLRMGPMTIKEIETAYNNAAARSDIFESKSYNTIYRYLKTLEEANLVTAAGKRVAFGKTASETLFSRTAKMFHYGITIPYSDMGADSQRVADHIVKAMKYIYDGYELSEGCLRDYMNEFSDAITHQIESLIERADEKTLQTIAIGEFEEMLKVLDYVGIFGIILNQPDVFQKLTKCFKKSK
jgi:DNA-binding transcriptional ArsR family regulator